MAADSDMVMTALQNVIQWLKIDVTPSRLLRRIKEILPDLPLSPDLKRALPEMAALTMKPILLFGLSGQDGVGKDTAAKHLIDRGYTKVSFGAGVKWVVWYLYGIDRETLEGDDPVLREERELPLAQCPTLTMRDVMRLLATEVFRSIDDTVWIRHAARQMRYPMVVITDIRFENELNFVKRLDGIAILITCSSVYTTSAHESQRPLPDYLFAAKIQNDDDIRTLRGKLAQIEHMMASSKDIVICRQ